MVYLVIREQSSMRKTIKITNFTKQKILILPAFKKQQQE